MTDLSSWEREALMFLHDHPGKPPLYASTRDGIKGLVRKGLAEPIERTLYYRLTDAGRAEHDRRVGKRAA